MEVMKRILRVFRANLNSLIGSTEDPEKVLEQTVLEMQENLMQLRRGVAQAIAIQKRTERQAAAADSTAEEWYRRAQLALQQGNEPLAKEALTKRRVYQETAKTLSEQRLEQNTLVDKLKQDMRTLELKISEAKTKKDMFIARARSAEASAKLQEMLNGVSSTSSLNAFERMEDKVLQIEAQSEAIAQLGGDDLQKKFASLESSNDIDAELAAMKMQVFDDANNTPSQQQLPKNQDS
ncbi:MULTISPECIES: PspA/IM30 family protein [unclassified Tolypothrix]|uniref:PspA/IM30 family protein n=1 Tax=unclassified Tolypothrix TaxID=2649714 RepID=UPI0005EAC54D|nr:MULTISPECIES: PspA/IM30 family protein [unclassified Tolypothrix]BAY89151.1 phage shock protein A, PspA [Microchaete diplosiphon NIES-3275]EKE96833.1 phage shock protein A [Tolypothrix sp. PCC 7601]MBE9084486.1 PspA/IM30 family protein [Tolypothrix sp. LEGE 11397]UYD23450.1 PspA/IM30 family protein [Tolypothrix sp. PCC 7712]UYD34319.1 PspA/IM30 family protein [Tolypothrix sp. PCC 7601]